MNSVAFWKSWSKPYQSIFWALSLTLLLSVLFFWAAYYSNPAPSITWDQFQQLNTEEVRVRTFSKGIFDFPVYSDNYLIYEILSGSELQPETNASYFFLVVCSISIVVLLSVVSSLSRFWFITGMGIFCLFMMTLQLESTEVFGITNKIPSIISLLVFCVLSYYFHALRSTSSFITRLLSFSAVYLLLLATIAFLATLRILFFTFQ